MYIYIYLHLVGKIHKSRDHLTNEVPNLLCENSYGGIKGVKIGMVGLKV